MKPFIKSHIIERNPLKLSHPLSVPTTMPSFLMFITHLLESLHNQVSMSHIPVLLPLSSPSFLTTDKISPYPLKDLASSLFLTVQCPICSIQKSNLVFQSYFLPHGSCMCFSSQFEFFKSSPIHAEALLIVCLHTYYSLCLTCLSLPTVWENST